MSEFSVALSEIVERLGLDKVYLSENYEETKISSVEINCEKLTYISSAGLRVLLATHKKMSGALTLTNVCELVMEVFEITGFVDVLTIK